MVVSKGTLGLALRGCVVIDTAPGSSANLAGIQAGDRILSVDLRTITDDNASACLRGVAGSFARISLLRQDGKQFDVVLERKPVGGVSSSSSNSNNQNSIGLYHQGSMEDFPEFFNERKIQYVSDGGKSGGEYLQYDESLSQAPLPILQQSTRLNTASSSIDRQMSRTFDGASSSSSSSLAANTGLPPSGSVIGLETGSYGTNSGTLVVVKVLQQRLEEVTKQNDELCRLNETLHKQLKAMPKDNGDPTAMKAKWEGTLARMEKLQQQNELTTHQNAELTRDRDLYKAQNMELLKEIEILRLQGDRVQEEMDKMNRENGELASAIRGLQMQAQTSKEKDDEIRKLKEASRALELNIEALQQQNTDLTNQNLMRQERISILMKQKEDAEKERDSLVKQNTASFAFLREVLVEQAHIGRLLTDKTAEQFKKLGDIEEMTSSAANAQPQKPQQPHEEEDDDDH